MPSYTPQHAVHGCYFLVQIGGTCHAGPISGKTMSWHASLQPAPTGATLSSGKCWERHLLTSQMQRQSAKSRLCTMTPSLQYPSKRCTIPARCLSARLQDQVTYLMRQTGQRRLSMHRTQSQNRLKPWQPIPQGLWSREPAEMASVQMLSPWCQALSPPLAPVHPPPGMRPGPLRHASVCSTRSC